MKLKKYLISSLAIVSMALSLGPSNSHAKNFYDVQSSHWAYNMIEELSSIGYISGYPDGSFRPDNKLSRQDAAILISNYFNKDLIIKTDRPIKFNDIEGVYGKQHIDILSQAGIIKGYSSKNFRPGAPITRAEISTMITNALLNINYTSNNYSSVFYNDLSSSHWAYKFIIKLTKYSLIKGYPDGSFRPDTNITRAEMVAILSKITIRNSNATVTPTKPKKEPTLTPRPTKPKKEPTLTPRPTKPKKEPTLTPEPTKPNEPTLEGDIFEQGNGYIGYARTFADINKSEILEMQKDGDDKVKASLANYGHMYISSAGMSKANYNSTIENLIDENTFKVRFKDAVLAKSKTGDPNSCYMRYVIDIDYKGDYTAPPSKSRIFITIPVNDWIEVNNGKITRKGVPDFNLGNSSPKVYYREFDFNNYLTKLKGKMYIDIMSAEQLK